MFHLSILSFFAALCSVAAANNITTPLNVVNWDLFGDTWRGARFYLEKVDGKTHQTAPDCEHNPRLVRVTPAGTGLYYLVVNTPSNTVPQESWEIFWTVQVGDNGEKHSGHFNTTMVWHYDEPTDAWTLAYFNNLIDNEKDVSDDACSIVGDSKQCKKKPTPPPQPKPVEKPEGGNKAKAEKVEFEGPKYGPPAVDVAVTMFDEEADGWWKNNYLGASWYIYDSSRTELFHQGTLSDGAKGGCKLCLGDGPYLFRATGDKKVLFQESDWVIVDHKTHETSGNATDKDFIAWDFCGVRGRYYDELHFHVKKGKCIPDYITPLDDICGHVLVHAAVKIAGSLSVSGVTTEIFDEVDAKLVVSTLVQELPGLQYTDISILSTSIAPSVAQNGRKLSTYSHIVNFQVAFDTEKTFGFNGKSVSAVESLVSSLQTTLQNEIASGAFVSAMTSLASTNAANSMSAVSGVSLLSFELASVSYAGVRNMEVSQLDAAIVETSAGDNHDFASIAMFLAAIGVGVIALVGIMSARFTRSYSNVVQDSTHNVSEVNMQLELETNISDESSIRSVSRPQINL